MHEATANPTPGSGNYGDPTGTYADPVGRYATPGSAADNSIALVMGVVRPPAARDAAESVIRTLIADAVAEEREACVAAVAGMRDDFMGVEAFRRKVVAAIRARG